MDQPDDERRFEGAAPFYAPYRVPYPPELIALVARHCGLDREARLLDLGCGPGLLALAFAPFVGGVIGLDPEPAMLAEAEAAARQAGRAIDFRPGRAPDDLVPSLAPLRLVTIGRAFHWMDRPATLAALDRLVEPGGAVAFFFDSHVETAENAWVPVFDALRDEFGKLSPVHVARKRSDWVAHEQVLLDSPFSDLTGINRIWRRRLTLDDLVGRAFSLSATSPAALGERRAAFEATLRRRIREAAGTDHPTEIVEAYALIARRP